MAILSKTQRLPLLVILIAALGIGLLFVLKPKPPTQKPANRLPRVNFLIAEPASFQPVVNLYGQVESPHTSTLSAASQAYVDAIHIQEGDSVTTGELLVTLDAIDAELLLAQRQADLQDVQAQLKQLRNRLQADKKSLKLEQDLLALANKAASRQQRLAKKSLGSQTQRDLALEKAKRQALSVTQRQLAVTDFENQLARLSAQHKRARALLDQAELNVKRTQIRAPFDGRITKVLVSPQNQVRPGEAVVQLYDSEQIEIRAQIPHTYLSRVHEALASGTELQASIAINNSRNHNATIDAKLVRLAASISAGRGGVDAFFRLSPTTTALETGRTLELSLTLPAVADSLALAPAAIYRQSQIYQITADNHLKAISINRLGKLTTPAGKQKIIVSGAFTPGMRIMTSQLPNAISGLEVNPIETPETGTPKTDVPQPDQANLAEQSTTADSPPSGHQDEE